MTTIPKFMWWKRQLAWVSDGHRSDSLLVMDMVAPSRLFDSRDLETSRYSEPHRLLGNAYQFGHRSAVVYAAEDRHRIDLASIELLLRWRLDPKTMLLFFGTNDDAAGHHLRLVNDDESMEVLPAREMGLVSHDGTLAKPDDPRAPPQGRYLTIGGRALTCVSCWDRSVDNRPGSNASFITPGSFSFQAVLDLAHNVMPNRMRRRFPQLAGEHQFQRQQETTP